MGRDQRRWSGAQRPTGHRRCQHSAIKEGTRRYDLPLDTRLMSEMGTSDVEGWGGGKQRLVIGMG